MKIRVAKYWSQGKPTSTGPAVIETNGGEITRVREEDSAPGDVDIHTDLVAIPGFIDCHEHLGIEAGGGDADHSSDHLQAIEPIVPHAIKGVAAMQTMLQAGITSIRECGERPEAGAYLVKAIQRGIINGPRLHRAIRPVCRTGGHAWYLGREADGVEELRKTVRENIKDGCDFIKVMATGGFGTVGSDPTHPEFTLDELQAIVDEAHRFNKRVGAHAYGGAGVDDALTVGIDAIDHGGLLSSEQLKRMADQGTYMVATQGVGRKSQNETTGRSLREPGFLKMMNEIVEGYKQAVRWADEYGVLLCVGSDCVHGGVADEVLYLADCGLSTEAALTAATATGADLISLPTGRIDEQKYADIIFLDGDPFEDIAAVKRVRSVMLGGEWVSPLPN